MTRTLVGFRTEAGHYAVPVETTREVRGADGIMPLPAPRVGVVGLLQRGEEALPVLDALGGGRRQVLVLEPGEQTFGLLVEEVTGVMSVDEAEIGEPPAGQEDPVVVGVVPTGETLVLLVDATALAAVLAE
jgi:chemotaxis signal transduction protein